MKNVTFLKNMSNLLLMIVIPFKVFSLTTFYINHLNPLLLHFTCQIRAAQRDKKDFLLSVALCLKKSKQWHNPSERTQDQHLFRTRKNVALMCSASFKDNIWKPCIFRTLNHFSCHNGTSRFNQNLINWAAASKGGVYF